MTKEKQKTLFGTTLRKLRANKNMPQFDLAMCLEWRGTAGLSQFENGRRLPYRETIDRLIACLNLSFAEGCLLLGLAGEIPDEELPKPYQIIKALNAVVETLNTNTAIIDYKMNVWFGMAGKNLFDSGGDLVEVLQQFKAMNVMRQHLPFYRQYPECMKTRLSAAEYRAFEKAWESVEGVPTMTTIASLNHLFALVPYEGERVKLWETFDITEYWSGAKDRIRMEEV